MAKHSEQTVRNLLLQLVREGYDHKTWHGNNLKASIRRVKPAEAGWRLRSGRKNIAEIVLHCAYWKYTVRRRLLGEKRGSFVLKGSNWFELPSRLSEARWKECVKILDAEHRLLVDAVAGADWEALSAGDGKPAAHVHGVALHDVYHAGQIQTIKALNKQRG